VHSPIDGTLRPRTSLRQKLQGAEAVLGVSIALTDPLSVEMAGAIGFDFVLLEFAHDLRDGVQLLGLMRAAHQAGAAVLVRAADLTPNLVGRMLDSGATGIVASQVRDAAEVSAIVRWAKYPPEGERSSTGQRWHVSPYRDAPDPFQAANDDVLIFAMTERPEAVANVSAILDVAGLTGIIPGQGDLAMHLGLGGAVGAARKSGMSSAATGRVHDAPALVDALDRLRQATAARPDRILIEQCTEASQVERALQAGTRALLLGSDQLLLVRAYADAFKAARVAVTSLPAGPPTR
jgi:2-keto-3-deoxy-L-rhamnonate aldolase RhmA